MKAMLMNSLWLMLERVSLSLSGIFVSVYVARYLGPAQYGLINYLLSVIAIAVPLVQLGPTRCCSTASPANGKVAFG